VVEQEALGAGITAVVAAVQALADILVVGIIFNTNRTRHRY
jgi:hypothetical protein